MPALTQSKHALSGRRYGSFASKGLARSFSESVTFSELLVGGKLHTEVLSDVLFFTETVARAWTFSIGDTLVFVDLLNYAGQVQHTIDAIEFAETYNYSHSFNKSVSDSLAFTERLAKTSTVNLTDTLAFTETTAITQIRGYNYSDILTFVDVLGYVKSPYFSFGDGLNFVDLISMTKFPSKNQADNLTFAETLAKTKFSGSGPGDTLSFGETTALTVFRCQRPSDTLIFAETIVHSITGARSTSDALVFDEVMSQTVRVAPRLGDFLDFNESYGLNLVRNFGFCDCLEFVDRVARVQSAAIADTLVFTDYIDRTNAHDTLTFVETWTTNIIEGGCCRDQDYLNSRLLTDTLVFAESLVVSGNRNLIISDTIVFNDSLMYL